MINTSFDLRELATTVLCYCFMAVLFLDGIGLFIVLLISILGSFGIMPFAGWAK